MSRAMLDACDRIGMLVMDETFDMWTEPKMDDDYSHAFPDWWEADVDAMVRKDRNHPCVIMYSIGNEIPDTGRPSGAALGRAIAERIRALDDTRLVTNSINPLLVVRYRAVRVARRAGSRPTPTEDTGINTMMTMMEQYLPIILQNEVVDERTAESYAYLDVRGYNYTESRYEMDHELHPHRVIVGSENRPAVDRRELAAGARAPARDRRLHLDRLGLPRRGRHRTRAVRRLATSSGGFMGAYPWLTAQCGDFDITGHRRPVSYWREIVWGLRADALPRGAAARAPRRSNRRLGSWLVVHRRVAIVVVARLRGPARHGRGLRRRRRGRAAPERHASRSSARGRRPPVPCRVRDHLHAGRAHRGRVPRRRGDRPHVAGLGERAGAARRAGRPLARSTPTIATSRTSRSRWSTAGGNVYIGEDRAVTVAIDGPARAPGLRERQPVHRGDASARRRTTRSTAARSR